MKKRWAACAAAVMLSLNAAEAAMLAQFCAGISEDLLVQVAAASEVLRRCGDDRCPDTVTGVLAGAGYRHSDRISEEALAQAEFAVEVAEKLSSPGEGLGGGDGSSHGRNYG